MIYKQGKMKDRIMNILFYPKEELLPLAFDLNLCFGPPWCKVQTTQYFKFYRGPRKKGPKKFLLKEMLWLWSSLCIIKSKKSPKSEKKISIQLISYKRYLECTRIQGDYLPIPKCTVSCGFLFHEIPSSPQKNINSENLG